MRRASQVTTAPSRSTGPGSPVKMAGLVVLDADLEMVQQVPAVLGDAEKMDSGAVSAPGAAGGLAVHGHCP